MSVSDESRFVTLENKVAELEARVAALEPEVDADEEPAGVEGAAAEDDAGAGAL